MPLAAAPRHPLERDWMIVAPWWHWAPPAAEPVAPDPQRGRLTRPVFQKYDSPSFVNDLLADPQRSLRFVEEDLVHARRAAPPIPAGLHGKPRRLSDEQYVPDGTDTRKLFLDTHKRFYAVCCGVHCDAPGFPKVARDKICQAGFVVRRRTVTPPGAGVAEVKPVLRALANGRSQLARVNQLAGIEALAQASSNGTATAAVHSAKLESLLKTRGSLVSLLEAQKARLDDWVARFGVVPQLQGWLRSGEGFDRLGRWAEVDEMPDELGLESSFQLYPIVPGAGDERHAARYGTLLFGLVPTSSSDTDPLGGARFDDREIYEVRCWVRRHKVPHDPDQPCPCPDGIFWSVPTRPFKLASQFDLDGTGHRPVTVQLPDLRDLAAQARPALGVAFAKPKGSLMVSGDKDGKPQSKGLSADFEICSFPIPLITIVASFVFELFLPVVVVLFQLWWMLALKFCIPPQIDVAGGLGAELALDASLAFEASIEADVNLSVQTNFGAEAGQGLIDAYAPIALANMEIGLKAASDPQAGPSAQAGLEFEAEVRHS